MARYEDDFEQWGTRSVLRNPGARGMDPNFRGGGYQGERMRAGQPGQAPYGRFRQLNANDLQGFGGADGRYGGYDQPYRRERPASGYDRDVRQARRGGYDREQRQGNQGGPRGDTGYLRDFNKNSPALRGDEGPRGQTRRASGFADDSPDPRQWRTGGAHRYGEEHNRYGGHSPAGFTEYWLPKQAPRGTPMPHRK